LTRWAAGDRDTSGQVSTGEFALQGMAKVGDGELKLAEASGELSGTKFRGDLRFQGGARSLIELSLDSDRLDLREMIGDGPIWRSWTPETPTRKTSGRHKLRLPTSRICSPNFATTTCA